MSAPAREPWEERGPPWRVVLMEALAMRVVLAAKLFVAAAWVAVGHAVLFLATFPPEKS